MEMTKDALVKVCRENGGYARPSLNDQLFLQCKGFCEIANLEEYTELKALWLDQNAIQEIEGLDALKRLSSLFIQSNSIRAISGLQNLGNLRSLNLSHNHITKITGLGGCPLLETLQVSHNRIEQLDDCAELLQLEHLSCVDLSHNRMEERPANAGDLFLVEFFRRSQSKELSVIYLHGQGLPRHFKNYRKTMVANLPQLTYLDERPVFPEERRTAEAWNVGGADAEKAEREKIHEEKKEKLTACLRYQQMLDKPEYKAYREQREREYREKLEAEKAWRQQRREALLAKINELDEEEYEGRGLLEIDMENDYAAFERDFARGLTEAREQETARLEAEEKERERLAVEAAAAAEIAAQEAAAAAELEAARKRERATQKKAFDEMQFWVKKFVEEDAIEEAELQAGMDEIMNALQPGGAFHHSMPSTDQSTSGRSREDTDSVETASATNSITDHENSSNSSSAARSRAGRQLKKAATRWAKSAARYEQFYEMERKRNGQ